jgi:hypothetical protein
MTDSKIIPLINIKEVEIDGQRGVEVSINGSVDVLCDLLLTAMDSNFVFASIVKNAVLNYDVRLKDKEMYN